MTITAAMPSAVNVFPNQPSVAWATVLGRASRVQDAWLCGRIRRPMQSPAAGATGRLGTLFDRTSAFSSAGRPRRHPVARGCGAVLAFDTPPRRRRLIRLAFRHAGQLAEILPGVVGPVERLRRAARRADEIMDRAPVVAPPADHVLLPHLDVAFLLQDLPAWNRLVDHLYLCAARHRVSRAPYFARSQRNC